MDILLIAGLWLDAAAWDPVVPALTALGHRPVPIALPSQGGGDTAATLEGQIGTRRFSNALPGEGAGDTPATLEDQMAAVVAAVDATSDKPLVVGHSAACSL